MKKVFLIKLLLIHFLVINLSAGDIFFMPKDSKKAMKTLLKELDLAKNEINVAIYSFTHKEIAKKLKNASKRGVKVKIIFDDESNTDRNRRSQIGNLAKIKSIKTRVIKGKQAKSKRYFGKMHNKFIIIDNKTVIFGSANFSYSAFGKNYEILYIEKDYALAKKFNSYFDKMFRDSKSY